MDNIKHLLCACQKGDVEIAEHLLESGVGVDSENDDGITPLQVAAAHGNEDVVGLLLERRASVDKENKLGWTPLMQAARNGHAAIVTTLVAHEADVNHCNKLGVSVLCMAAASGQQQIVRRLIDLDSFQHSLPSVVSPLYLATLNGSSSVVQLLLNRAFDPNVTSFHSGVTPLMVAASVGDKLSAKLLLERGSDANATNALQETALDVAIATGNLEVKAYLEKRTKRKPQTGVLTSKGDIFQAVRNNDIVLAHMLLRGCDHLSNAESNIGITPLMMAAVYGNLEISMLLLRAGADVNKQERSSCWTALMLATYQGQKKIIHLLLDVGADANLQTADGCTAFDIAMLVENSDAELIRALASRSLCVMGQLSSFSPLQRKKRPRAASDSTLDDDEDSNQGIKAWWYKMSSRFRHLKLGRSSLSPYRLQIPKSPTVNRFYSSGVFFNSCENFTISKAMESMGCGNLTMKLPSDKMKPVVPPLLTKPKRKGHGYAKTMMPPGRKLSSQDFPAHTPFSSSECSWGNELLSNHEYFPEIVTKEPERHLKCSIEADRRRRISIMECASKDQRAVSCIHVHTKSSSGEIKDNTVVQTSFASQIRNLPSSEKVSSMVVRQESSLVALLCKLQLETLIPIFSEQEMDLETFFTLRDCDLQEMGILDENCRERIVEAITTMQIC